MPTRSLRPSPSHSTALDRSPTTSAASALPSEHLRPRRDPSTGPVPVRRRIRQAVAFWYPPRHHRPPPQLQTKRRRKLRTRPSNACRHPCLLRPVAVATAPSLGASTPSVEVRTQPSGCPSVRTCAPCAVEFQKIVFYYRVIQGRRIAFDLTAHIVSHSLSHSLRIDVRDCGGRRRHILGPPSSSRAAPGVSPRSRPPSSQAPPTRRRRTSAAARRRPTARHRPSRRRAGR